MKYSVMTLTYLPDIT